MPRINEHYLNLQSSYLFAEIKRRTQAYREAHPEDAVWAIRPRLDRLLKKYDIGVEPHE